MNKFQVLISLLLIFSGLKANANRALYVDNFAAILGDTAAEDELLTYAQAQGIETLLLYELHLVNANINLPNPATNYVLADFISKAKTSYGILYVGGSGESNRSGRLLLYDLSNAQWPALYRRRSLSVLCLDTGNDDNFSQQ